MKKELLAAIKEIPVIDVHSHFNIEKPKPSHPDNLLFYHMLCYPMASVGGSIKLLWPDEEVLWKKRLEEFFSLKPSVENSFFFSLLKDILAELYDFKKDLTYETYDEFEEKFNKINNDPDRTSRIFEENHIEGVLTSNFNLNFQLEYDWQKKVFFTFERSPLSGIREYVPWYERLNFLKEKKGINIKSVEDLDELFETFFSEYKWDSFHAFVCWISSVADFTPVPYKVINKIIKKCLKNDKINKEESNLLDATVVRAMCKALKNKTKVFQLVYGIQYLFQGRQYAQNRANFDYITGLGYLFKEFPEIHFNILSGYELHEPLLCSLCLAFPNVSIAGFWWQMFYPSVMRNSLNRRLDMLPSSKLMMFFSDAYCVDWLWARLKVCRSVLADILVKKIEYDGWSFDFALKIAKDLLYDTPYKIFLKN